MRWAAALYAAGHRFGDPVLTGYFAEWPWLLRLSPRRLICPVAGCDYAFEGRSYHGAIVHLNDVHEWSRLRIADWVEGIEIEIEIEIEKEQERKNAPAPAGESPVESPVESAQEELVCD